tara:strand:+ start:48 stop:818 length:771 start_codon:yes stop_codon:yes gene_type:complete
MGFLNHATNNVIIDAVLTERGRELLSRNDGSFKIKSFAFGDDEVDYSLISKYGVSVGKEKIEKNTPVFESNPNENIAIKHPLITFTNPLLRITQIPTFKRSDSTTNTTINLYDRSLNVGSDTGVIADFTIQNSIVAADQSITLDPNITDNRVFVKMHGKLIKMDTSQDVRFIDTDVNGIDTYEVTTSFVEDGSKEWQNQIFVKLFIRTKGVVTAKSFTEFAIVGETDKINTSVQVIGASSGATIVVPVLIQKNTAS